MKEGNLEAPKRAAVRWQEPEYLDQDALYSELERAFDICHGCRRCVSLCDSFPTLFDLVDESDTMEVDGVSKDDYMKVADQCFLCDLCAETKCPYLPPHEWALDFPKLMLRAKAYKFEQGQSKWRDRLITSTDTVFNVLAKPGIAALANGANANGLFRKAIDSAIGLHPDAPLPPIESGRLVKQIDPHPARAAAPLACERTTGKVAVFVTCYGDATDHALVEDLIAVLAHNGMDVKVLQDAKCCGMPKLELGDLKSVEALKDANIPVFLEAIEQGYDILSPIPSCVLMYKQELPLMFSEDAEVERVKTRFFDPFEYLMLRHKANLLSGVFKQGLGKVAYHAACHQRVQNFGAKTREFLSLLPDTEVTMIDRCSGHDGTYALKSETYDKAMKIARPVVNRVAKVEPDTFGSDCPMAGRLIAHGMADRGNEDAAHPITMIRRAYGI
ncbi:MAG: heterodisulfide reductase-related iron-sulfur binding cluster [Pseudomonadota bacterium]